MTSWLSRWRRLSPNAKLAFLLYPSLIYVGLALFFTTPTLLTTLAVAFTVYALRRVNLPLRVLASLQGRAPLLLAAVALLLVLVCAFYLRETGRVARLGDFSLLLYAGLFLLPLYQRHAALFYAPPLAQATPRLAFGWAQALSFGAGVLCLWALADSNINLLTLRWELPPLLQFSLLCLGIGLAVGAFWGGPSALYVYLRRQWWTDEKISLPRLPSCQNPWVRAGTLFLLAFGVRLWALGTAWPDFVDEMHSAAGVTHFWPSVGFEDKRLLMPYGNITSFPRLYPFLLSWSVGLFGESLASLRGVSVLFGALTIPALYGLARNLYDEKTALVAGLLLATFPPHYHFSRIALNNIIDPFFGVAALAVLAYAMRTGRARHFALAGALLGLTQYWYEGGRLLYPPLFLIWGGWAWALASFQRGRWGVESPLAGWGGLRGLAVSVLLFIVVAMPIYYVLWGDYRPYTSRLDDQGLSLSEWRDYLRAAPDDPRWERHFTSPLLVLTSRPDGGWFYRGEKPFIGYWLLPFALLGALFAFVRVLGRGGFLLVLWVLATLLGNTFIVTPDWSPRYVVVFPALMLITALGLRHLPYLWALMGGGARVGGLMLALVTLILSATSLDYYFNVHLPYNRRQDLAFNHQIDAFSRVADLPPNTHAHFIDDQVYWRFNLDTYRTFHRLTQTFDNIQPQQLDFQYLLSLPRDVPHAFFIDPDDQRSLQMVSFYFLLAPPVPSPDPRLPRERQLWMYYYDPLK